MKNISGKLKCRRKWIPKRSRTGMDQRLMPFALSYSNLFRTPGYEYTYLIQYTAEGGE